MKSNAKALLTFILAAATACHQSNPPQPRAVQRWLLCEECVEGELDAVVALGDEGVRGLEAALRGPPEDRVANMRRQAEAMYARIPSPRTSRQDYVDHYLSNYKSLYHSRAITALRRINTPTTHAILISALQRDSLYREDVRRQLGEATGAEVSVAIGDRQHALLGSFVNVNPTVLIRDSATGLGLSKVRVVFRVDSGGGKVADSVQLTGSDGKAGVRWKLGPQDSTNVLRGIAAGRSVRIHALGHPPGPRLVFVRQPGGGTRGQPLTPAPAIAVQDPSGVTLTNFNQTAVVTVLPTNVQVTQGITNGVAVLSGLTINEVGRGFRLRVRTLNVPPAESAPFSVVP